MDVSQLQCSFEVKTTENLPRAVSEAWEREMMRILAEFTLPSTD